MRQEVLEIEGVGKFLMWEDGSILIEHQEERSVEFSVQQMAYVVQRWQELFGPIPFRVFIMDWRGWLGTYPKEE